MSFSIPANLIRQWCYCPRKVYYMELMKVASIHRPMWVKQGEEFHELETKLWSRRNLSRFGLEQGKKHYQLMMKSVNLGLHGIADLVIETENCVYPVEFKLSASNKRLGDILQLVAYGLLAEKHFAKPVEIGFLVGKGRVLHSISLDKEKRQRVKDVMKSIHEMLERARKPDSSATLAQCGGCEYVNFCNDRF